MTDVFISYSRKDSGFVHHLFEALKGTERQAWVDWEDIPITAEWWNEIQHGIEAADSFLFVISPDSVMSPVCNQEIEYAVAHNKRLIPLVRRDVMGEAVNKALARHNWLFCRETDSFEQAFNQLIEALNTDLEYVRNHTRLLIRAREWESLKRDASYLLRGSDLQVAESWLAESGGKEPKPTETQTQYILASRRASNSRQRTILAGVSVAFAATLILALVSLELFSLAETRRQESDQRGTAVAQQAGTATNALGLSQVRGTQVAQSASTAVAAEATSERRSVEWQSLAWSVDAQQALDAGNDDLGLALALQADSVTNPPAQSQSALVEAAYAPGTGAIYSGQHSSWIIAADVSPDDQWLISGGYDGKLVLWKVATGQVVQTTQMGNTPFNAEGMTISLGSPTSVTFIPTASKPTALIGQSSGDLSLWDVDSWKATLNVNTGTYINTTAISPDGSIAAVGSAHVNDNLVLWNTSSLTKLRGLTGHTDDVESLAFSADGKQLLSGSNDATVRLWDVATGSLIRTFGPVTDSNNSDVDIKGVVFGPPLSDGTPTGIGATNSGQIIAWNLNTGAEIRRYEVGDTPTTLSHIAISPDQRLLATSGLDNILYLWDTSNGHLIRRYLGHTAPLTHAVFSADERSIFSASQDQTLRRWYTISGAELRTMHSPDGFSSLAINGTRALTGGRTQDPAVILWDLQTGTVIQRMKGHTDSVISVAFSPDGKTALSGSFDGSLRLWDLDTGQALKVFPLDNILAIPSVEFSPDGKTALISTITKDYVNDGWGALIDLSTGNILKKFDSDPGLTTEAIYSPDHQQILVGGAGIDGKGVITLWNAQTGTLIRQFQPGHTSAITTLQFSADGSKVLSAGQDFNSILWDVASGKEIRRFVGDTDVVSSAAFSADEQTMISGSYDGTIRLWDVNTGSEIFHFDIPTDTVRSVIFAPDGRTAYSVSREGSLTQWEVTADALTVQTWLQGNRYVRPLTCAERAQYQVDPLCMS